jgi:hypothetical protein
MTEELRQDINKIAEFHYLVQELQWSSSSFNRYKSKENGMEKSNGKILAAPTPFSPFKFAHQIFKSWQFL